MSITDELREWGRATLMPSLLIKMETIADRIDAEHEEAIQQALIGEGGVPATDENMAEHGWIRLPKDADGEYINIGDVMAYADNTKPMEVVALVPPAVFLTEDGPRYADMCRHYHAPTVEDVLREFTYAILEWSGKSGTVAEVGTWSDVVDEYAAKLQLREDA